MSTTYADDYDTGEIRAGEQTVNLAPFTILPPALRRPDATGEIPAVRFEDAGLGILTPISPAPPVEDFTETVVLRYAVPGPRHAAPGRPAKLRRGRGRHRRPSLLGRAWLWLVAP
ncbi:MAG TPA: hypothetical protein VGR06_26400 [Actinophytocola sp.]|jgi:hypothetical protein|uniref:hypothetical protein n=1 Tax=Actinophytocola sp. TaxID=1872138 RepID=UPI002E0033CA|nr:hypothetical protein [Actinophytocola sp.]